MSISSVLRVQFPYTLPTIDLIILFNIHQSDVYRMRVHCHFNLHFLGTTKFEYFFHVLSFSGLFLYELPKYIFCQIISIVLSFSC